MERLVQVPSNQEKIKSVKERWLLDLWAKFCFQCFIMF